MMMPDHEAALKDPEFQARYAAGVLQGVGPDTTLLVNTPSTTWYFDDDSGPGLNSRLRISNLAALNGQVSIWVGTYGSDTCDDVDVRIRVRDD